MHFLAEYFTGRRRRAVHHVHMVIQVEFFVAYILKDIDHIKMKLKKVLPTT